MIIRRDFSGDRIAVSLTIGFFDGVHLGHQKVINKAVERAKAEGIKSCVVTFDRHPSELFFRKKVKFLTCWEEKKEILHNLGVDIIQVFTFNPKLSSLSPSQFLSKLNKIFDIRGIFIGEEFTFGYRREGNVEFLRQKQKDFGYTLEAVPSLKIDGKKISSSFLRELLQKGEIEKVIRAMGRPPTLLGEVVPGEKRGRELGYPTANLKPHPEKLLPQEGVYAGTVFLEKKVYKALINVGAKPTFGDFVPGVEVHLLGFTGKLYGETLKINLIKRIRDIKVFPSPSHLSKQLEKDKEKAEKILSNIQDSTFIETD